MLIRSQDKKQLHPLNSMAIVPKHKRELNSKKFIEGYQIVIFMGSDGDAIIGTYSTEEKAIKVLDMIQKYYGDYIKATGNIFFNAFNFPKVFQMPQDSEV